MIDTHGHLNLVADEAIGPVIDRCRAKGVTAVVVPGTDLADSTQAIRLAQDYPGYLFPAVGLHPTNLPKARDDETRQAVLGDLRKLIEDHRPVIHALGEVGYDFYHPGVEPEVQQIYLREFLSIAQESALPLIIHCRGARTALDAPAGPNPYELLVEDVRNHPKIRFVVHCFQGSAADLDRILALGGFISLTATITYSDHPSVVDVVRAIPPERLMIETDTPFLSPPPYRGTPNEPWRVQLVAERIADLTGQSLDDVLAATTATARQFFNLG